MATTAAMTRLGSLAANLLGKVNELLSGSSVAASSSSSVCSQIEEEVEKLRRKMRRIQALLNDAEEREISDDSIKLWLDELRDVAYDAEDAVEEFEYELLTLQLVREEEENGGSTHEERGTNRNRQVCDSHATPPCPALHDATFQQQIVDKIKEINNRFDEIYNDRRALKLGKEEGKRNKKQKGRQRRQTSSLLGNSPVYGRDEDKDEVVDMLLSSQFCERRGENASVVSIIGMGGIGKTTLAQLVYNDDRVKTHFEPRLWVYVSDCFDVLRLTKEILTAVAGRKKDLKGFNQLQEKLQNHLKGKRFLLVLDDLWNEDWEQWESLWKPLGGGGEGSKVLVTTRNEEVLRTSRAISVYHLKGLSKNDCLMLFEQCAFGWEKPENHSNLMSIGKRIVQKCGGLPLAIRTLGALLFNETDEDRWNNVSKSDIWDLPKEKNGILPALKLSYQHLPLPIKPCFAFCALFPKDYVFNGKTLVWLWMAEGYINPSTKRSMENVGQEYVEELLKRSFFQKFRPGVFKMHDLIHDLALFVLRAEYSTVQANSSRKIRHLLFNCEADITALLSCGSTNKFAYLRTSYLMTTSLGKINLVFSSKVLNDMFQSMKYLRVLCLLDMPLYELPDSVGNLKHLRYLGICIKCSNCLPESLGNLLNLQTLEIIADVYMVEVELPGRLKDLLKLQHINLHWCRLSLMPQGIGRLTRLQTLSRFVVGKGICAAGIEELRHLNDLQEELTIDVRSLNNWVIREPILHNTKGLKTLHLRLLDFEDTCDNESGLAPTILLQEELLELIHPHTNIVEFSISGYNGARLPRWMEDPSYLRLRVIELCKCKNCRHLPALGQLPSLTSLSIEDMYAVQSVGSEFLGDGMPVDGGSSFPSLEALFFKGLPELEELLLVGTEDGGTFPCLSQLDIEDCCRLRHVQLPILTALRELNISRCDELTTLDYLSTSPSGSLWLPQEAVHHMHIPLSHTMRLEDCPKLKCMPAAQQQRLPSSPQHFGVAEGPLLTKWVGSDTNNLVGIAITMLLTDGGHLVLHSIGDVQEVRGQISDLPDNIKKLELRWDLLQHLLFPRPAQAEEVLREFESYYLQLRELEIKGYSGRSFPDWVANPDGLPNLVKMILSGCTHCDRLPPLGQLPVLREIYISDMYEIEHVGREFCGEGLQRNGGVSFPKLQVLSISNCPKLRTFQVPALVDSSVESVDLSLYCGEMASSGIAMLLVGDSPELVSSVGAHRTSCRPTRDFSPCLEVLLIQDCPNLVSFVLVGMHGICATRSLFLVRCPILDFSHEARMPPKLEYANILGCPLLSGWCQGDRVSHLRGLWVDCELAFSDGKYVNVLPKTIETDVMSIEEQVECIRKIMGIEDTCGTTNSE